MANVELDLSQFKPGDHVGIGCMVDSCQHCKACKQVIEPVFHIHCSYEKAALLKELCIIKYRTECFDDYFYME